MLIFCSYQLSELQQWGGAVTVYLSRESAPGFEELGACSVIITITPLEPHNEKTRTQKREQAYKLCISELSLAALSRAAEPGSQTESWNNQMITRIQGMNSRKLKQIHSACSY